MVDYVMCFVIKKRRQARKEKKTPNKQNWQKKTKHKRVEKTRPLPDKKGKIFIHSYEPARKIYPISSHYGQHLYPFRTQ